MEKKEREKDAAGERLLEKSIHDISLLIQKLNVVMIVKEKAKEESAKRQLQFEREK